MYFIQSAKFKWVCSTKFCSKLLNVHVFCCASLTIVTDVDYGEIDAATGEYNGIFGLFQKNEADFALVPMSIIGILPDRPSPMRIGPTLHQWNTVLASYSERPHTFFRKAGVEESLHAIQYGVYLIYFLLAILVGVIIKTSHSLHGTKGGYFLTMFELFSRVMTQWDPNHNFVHNSQKVNIFERKWFCRF